MRKTLLAIILGCTALVAAACGGGAGSPGTSLEPIESLPLESVPAESMPAESPSDLVESPSAS
jgi:hypothetical protein